ncbi:MAG TPA: hypothetical protein VFU23_08680 [Gemmatimonadales bacterium]|nr:hypothetical protein [Gemmatimonadales bacterium]
MTAGATISWRDLPRSLRTMAAWLAVVQAVGYTTSLVYVWLTTQLAPSGIAGHYRGTDPGAAEGSMHFEKSFAEMLTITHTHLLGMAAIFALSGAALALCTTPPERWRRFLIVEPLVALLVSFASMWLMRYADPRFAWLLEISSTVMAATFYVQTFLVLRELRRVSRETA